MSNRRSQVNRAGEVRRVSQARRVLTLAATATLGGAVLAACGSSSSSSSNSKSTNSTNSSVITMAEGAQGTPDSILPFVEPAYNTLANKGSFQNFMWPALYSYGQMLRFKSNLGKLLEEIKTLILCPRLKTFATSGASISIE